MRIVMSSGKSQGIKGRPYSINIIHIGRMITMVIKISKPYTYI